jgi:hypothetical protein
LEIKMKTKFIYIVWSVILFLIGIGLLSGIIDYRKLSTQAWVVIEAGAALAFLITYFVDGTKKWGWLLPAFILAGMAIDLSKELYNFLHTQPNGVPIMIGIAAWFIIGFLFDRKHWWLLIPAYGLIFAAVETAINTMVTPAALYSGDNSAILLALTSGAATLIMLAVPFFVVYFVSKKSWWALIPAGILTTLGSVVAIQSFTTGDQNTLTGVYMGLLMFGSALTFGVLWLRRNTQPTRWAIIPAIGLFVLAILSFILGNVWNSIIDQTRVIVFAVISALCFIAYFVHGTRKWGWLFPALFSAAMAVTMEMSINGVEDSPIIGVLILFSLALPFYVGFALDRKRGGLLIPAVALTVVMAIVLLDNFHLADLAVFYIFAAPFYGIYIFSKKSWWAFIPAGVFTSFGLVVALEEYIPHAEYAFQHAIFTWGYYIWVLFLGFAATFGILWLRRKSQPTQWTLYPAIGFLALAILSFILGERFQELWLAAGMLITAGVLLLASLTNETLGGVRQTPEIKA